MADIASRIADMGFNCVRLPISVRGALSDFTPDYSRINFALNPSLEGLTWLGMLDATIDTLSAAGLMIIIDRHMLEPGNNPSNVSLQSRLWYGLGFSIQDNLDSLAIIAERTRNKKHVVAFDVINEPADYEDVQLTWGDGNPSTDLHHYYTEAGNTVLEKNNNLLVIAEGMCAGKTLQFLRDGPLVDLEIPNRVVYSVHEYVFFNFAGILSVNAAGTVLPLGLGRLDWWSWPWIADVCYWTSFAFAIVFALLFPLWYGAGRPKPYLSVLLLIVMSWLTLGLIIVWVVIYTMQWGLETTGACSLGAHEDVSPKLW